MPNNLRQWENSYGIGGFFGGCLPGNIEATRVGMKLIWGFNQLLGDCLTS